MSKESRDSKMFEKAAFGYRPDEVDRYVEELTKKIETLEAEKADQQAKMKILADKINEYRAEEGNLKDALLEAQRIKNAIETDARTRSEQLVSDAEERSAQLKAEAKAHATRLLSEAKARADQMVADAKKQADEAVGSVRGQVEAEQRILTRMQREVSSFKTTLISIYRSHLNLITSLPEEERKSAEEAAAAKQAPAEEPAPEAEAPAAAPEAEVPAEETDADRQAAFEERFGEVKINPAE
ncbi:MAG: DivIVA domain-containing protein [Oscillospiraceae bacterium]|nr:DivIVA domain-containing protein [Oscillospiraceae bacterium]